MEQQPSGTNTKSEVFDAERVLLDLQSGSLVDDPALMHSSSSEASDDEGRLSNRRYGIVIDAGSSGSRVLLYSWNDPRRWRQKVKSAILIENLGKKEDAFEMKVTPGLSSFANGASGLNEYLGQLLGFAQKHIPEHMHSDTPIYLYATAGMRMLSKSDQNAILKQTCDFVRTNYRFSTRGGCQMHFRVISGELEGILGWITVNYLKGRLFGDANSSVQRTFGFLDMGGASAQICFAPTKEMAQKHANDLKSLRMRFLDGSEVQINTFVSTFLGFGANQARRRYVDFMYNANSPHKLPASLNQSEVGESPSIVIDDPCLHRGFSTNTFIVAQDGQPMVFQLTGTGSFDECLDSMKPLLNKQIPCPDDPCLLNGVHAPIMSFQNHQFLGVSEFWYTTTSDLYHIGDDYNSEKFIEASRSFCSLNWSEIVKRFQISPQSTVNERIMLQCFKSAWIVSFLHEGLGIPRESDAKDTSMFDSVNELNNFPISWTLGAILLHASSTIPTLTSTSQSAETVSNSQMLDFAFVAAFLAVLFGIYLFYRNNNSAKKFDVSQFRVPLTSSERNV